MPLLKKINQTKRRIFKSYVAYYNVLTLIKFNIVICMKVTGETFSLSKEAKAPKRQDIKCI